MKFSQLWKVVVVLAAFLFLLNKRKPPYVIAGLLFAFKYLFYSYLPYGIVSSLQEFMEALIFPLALGFLFYYFKKKDNAPEKLIEILVFFAVFFIYSAVPFLFGLKGLNPETDLSMYGIKDNAVKGLFYHIANASKIFALSTLIVFNSYKRFSNTKLNKLFWLITVLLGSYLVYASWARTAWLFFFLGMIISFFYGKNIKLRVLASVFSVLMLLLVFYIYENNKAFQYRLSGGAVYRQNTELSLNRVASSRVPFIMTAIDNFENENFIGKIAGYGKQHAIDLFKKKTNMAIVSHNRTFEILESSGLVGLLLYLAFILLLFKSMKNYRALVSKEKKRLSFVLFFMFLGFYLTSHGSTIWGEVMIAILLISIKLDYLHAWRLHSMNPKIPSVKSELAWPK